MRNNTNPENQPIGVFDSGIGGLTVAKEIKSILPNESIVYFGDTMHVPYGNKSKQTVVDYSKQIAAFLIKKNCKAIVIACNTASANAFDEVNKILPEEVVLFDVIKPVASQVAYQLHQNVGVIATRSTIRSNVYKTQINNLNRSLIINQLETPLLVPIIEEGLMGSSISREALKHYLLHKKMKNIDSLILGCTHYPLLMKEIKNFYQGRVEIINSPLIVANFIKRELIKAKIQAKNGTKLQHQFFVSDYTKTFHQQAVRFFGQEVSLDEKKLVL